jgi:hypothetical protein
MGKAPNPPGPHLYPILQAGEGLSPVGETVVGTGQRKEATQHDATATTLWREMDLRFWPHSLPCYINTSFMNVLLFPRWQPL